MATAISRIYIQDGFVIAADGREKQSGTDIIASDREQKIFPLHHRSGSVSCAVTGSARIGESYRLSNEVPRIAGALENCDAANVGQYAEYLANDIKRSLESRFPTLKKTVTFQLLLDGYIASGPERARVIVQCGRESVPVKLEFQELYPKQSIGIGSSLIHRALFAPVLQYESLDPYWRVCQQELRTIDQAVAVARAIVQAHCDPRVACLDPGAHASFGGHIHVAKVTVSDGFEWVIGPLTPDGN